MIFRARQFDQCVSGRYAQDASLLGLKPNQPFPDSILLRDAPKEGQHRVLNLKHIHRNDIHYAEYEDRIGALTAVIFNE